MSKTFQRTCRYHPEQRLAPIRGNFALTGVDTTSSPGLVASASAATTPGPGLASVEPKIPRRMGRPNGQLFAVGVWMCEICGYVELSDAEL